MVNSVGTQVNNQAQGQINLDNGQPTSSSEDKEKALELQKELEQRTKNLADRARGASSNLASSEESYREYKNSWNFFRGLGGEGGALEKQIETERAYKEKLDTQLAKEQETQKRVSELIKKGEYALAAAVMEGKEQEYKQQMASASNQAMQGLQSANRDLQKTDEFLTSTETVLRTTRDGCVIAAAIVATGGAASAGFVAAAAAGTGAAAVVGGASNLTRVVADQTYGTGNYTLSSAVVDTGKDALTGLQIGVSGGAGAATGKLMLGQAGKEVGKQVVISMGRRVAVGMTSGAVSSLTGSVLQTSTNLAMGTEQRTWRQILADSTRQTIVGSLSGGIGVRGQGSIDQMITNGTNTMIKTLAIRATADVAAPTALSLSSAYGSHYLFGTPAPTAEQMIQETTMAILSSHVSAKVTANQQSGRTIRQEFTEMPTFVAMGRSIRNLYAKQVPPTPKVQPLPQQEPSSVNQSGEEQKTKLNSGEVQQNPEGEVKTDQAVETPKIEGASENKPVSLEGEEIHSIPRQVTEQSISEVANNIQKKLNGVTKEQIEEFINSYGADKEKALLILQRLSQFGNPDSLNDIFTSLQAYASKGYKVIIENDGTTLGDHLYYLHKDKKNLPGNGQNPFIIPKNITQVKKGIILIDDVMLHRLENDPALVSHIKQNDILLVYPDGWVDGLNLFSPTTNYKQKVDSLMARSGSGDVVNIEVVDRLKKLGLEPKIISRVDNEIISVDQVVNNLSHKGMTKECLTNILNKFPKEYHPLILEIFDRHLQAFSPQIIEKKFQANYEKILKLAADKGIKPEEIFFYVASGDTSYGLMTTNYRLANGISPSQVINQSEFSANPSKAKMLVIVDDVAGTGESLRGIYHDRRAGYYDNFQGEIVVAPLTATNDAQNLFQLMILGMGLRENTINQAMPNGDPKLHFMPSSSTKNLFEVPYFQKLPEDQKILISALIGHTGYLKSNTSIAFWHMTPNNNNGFAQHYLTDFLLNNAGNKISDEYIRP